MATSIGNLALILSANSSQFAAGVDSAKSSLSLFEKACVATFGAIQAAADRLTFKNMVGDIRAMTAAVNELGKAQQSLQTTASGAMKRWPEGTTTSSPRAAVLIGRAQAVQESRSGGQASIAIPDESKSRRAAEKARAAGEEADRLDRQIRAMAGPRLYGLLDESDLQKMRPAVAKRERAAAIDRALRGAVGDEAWGGMSAGVKRDLRAERARTLKANVGQFYSMPPPEKLTPELARIVMGVGSEEQVAHQVKNAARFTQRNTSADQARIDSVIRQRRDEEFARFQDEAFTLRERGLRIGWRAEDGSRQGLNVPRRFDDVKNEQLRQQARTYAGVTSENEKRLRENETLAMEMGGRRSFERQQADQARAEERASRMKSGEHAQRRLDMFGGPAMDAERAAAERARGLADRDARREEMFRQSSRTRSRPRMIAEAAENRADRDRAEAADRAAAEREAGLADRAARINRARQYEIRRLWGTDPRSIRAAEEKAMDARAAQNALGHPKQALGELAIQAYIAFHAFNAMRRALFGMVETGAQFEYQIKRLQVMTRASGPETKAAEEQVREIARTGIATHQDTAHAATRLGVAGFNIREVHDVLPTVSKMALLSGEDPAKVGDSFAVAMRSMQIAPTKKNAEYVGDVLALANTKSLGTMENMLDSLKFAAPYAHAAGMGIEEVSAALAVLSNAGLKGELGGTVMRGMLKKTAHQSEETRNAMQRLGISFEDAKGNFIGMGPSLKMLTEQTKDLGSMQRINVFSQIFDARAATGVLRLTQEGHEYQKMLDELQKGAKEGLLAKQTDELMDTTLMKINKMRAAFMEMKLSIASAFAPLTAALMDKVAQTMMGVKKLFSGDIAGGLSGVASMGLGMLAGGALGYRFGGAKGMLAGSAIGGAVSGSEGWFARIVQGGMYGAATGSVVPGVGTAFGAVAGTLVGGMKALVEALDRNAKSETAKRTNEAMAGQDAESDFLHDKDGKRTQRIMEHAWGGIGKLNRKASVGGRMVDVSDLSKEEMAALYRRGIMSGDAGGSLFEKGISAWQKARNLAEPPETPRPSGGLWPAIIPEYGKGDAEKRRAADLDKRAESVKAKQMLRARQDAEAKIYAEEEGYSTVTSKTDRLDRAKAGTKWLAANKLDISGLRDDERGWILSFQREKFKKQLGAFGDVGLAAFNRFRGRDTLDAISAIGNIGGGHFGRALPADMTDQQKTDQIELQKIFDLNATMNRSLKDQAEDAHLAARGHEELYEAHRAGLPWMTLEAEKVRLTGENLKELAQLEVREKEIRKQMAISGPNKLIGDGLALIQENQRLLQEKMLAQTEAKVAEEKQKVWSDTRMPMENYQANLRRLDALVVKGGMDWDTYSRAVYKAGGDLDSVNGSMSAWKAGAALEGGSSAAISAANYSRYGEEVSSGKQSEEHLREMRASLERIKDIFDAFGGTAGFAAAIIKGLGGDGILK